MEIGSLADWVSGIGTMLAVIFAAYQIYIDRRTRGLEEHIRRLNLISDNFMSINSLITEYRLKLSEFEILILDAATQIDFFDKTEKAVDCFVDISTVLTHKIMIIQNMSIFSKSDDIKKMLHIMENLSVKIKSAAAVSDDFENKENFLDALSDVSNEIGKLRVLNFGFILDQVKS